jgi:hypothetical protein
MPVAEPKCFAMKADALRQQRDTLAEFAFRFGRQQLVF